MKTFTEVRNAIIETYDAAEEHLDKANAAHQEGRLGEYHRHMTNFHDAMSEWHDDRGRSGSSDKHSRLADEHDDKARELGEATYDSEWDEKVKRLGRMAKEGQRKTVWDPVKRVYKTVPVNTQKPEVKEEKMKGKDPCWTGYKMLGTKNKNGKQVPNCIPESIEESIARLVSKSIKKVTARKPTPQEKADLRLNK